MKTSVQTRSIAVLLFILLILNACSKKAETCKHCYTFEVWTSTNPATRNDVDAGQKCGDELQRFESVKPVQGNQYQKYNRCN